MNKPSDKIYRALINLRTDPNFTIITQWINDSLISQSLKNNLTTGDSTRTMQGRNQELRDLLTEIQEAEDKLQSIQHPIRPPTHSIGGI